MKNVRNALETAIGTVAGVVIWWNTYICQRDFYQQIIKLAWEPYKLWRTGLSITDLWEIESAMGLLLDIFASVCLLIYVDYCIAERISKAKSKKLASEKAAI